MDSKLCTKCGLEKPAAEFPKDSRLLSGLSSQCRGCHAIRVAKHYVSNREKINASSRAWRLANPERAKELSKRYKKKISSEEWVARKAATKARQNLRYAESLKGRNIRKITGERFGLLWVLQYDGQDKWGSSRWVCLCKCGRVHTATAYNLTSGKNVSCGCRGITPLVCTTCGEKKEQSDFRKDSRKGADGINTKCKKCEAIRHRQWCLNNRDRLAVLRRKRWRSNPDVREKSRHHSKLAKFKRKTILASAKADFTAQQWRTLKAVYKNRCAYCGKRKPLTQDHVIPVSKGGDHTVANIIPSCQSCNSRKNARLPIVSYQPHLIA